jgi:hypothetical protein
VAANSSANSPSGVSEEQARANIGAKRRSRMKIDTVRIPTANAQLSPAVAAHPAFAPVAGMVSYFRRLGAPRPTRSRVTMTGSRFPGSRVVASDHLPRDVSVSSGINGRQLSAYSCGGSRGIVQDWTHRIPLVSPFGHYRSQTWHPAMMASTAEAATAFEIAMRCVISVAWIYENCNRNRRQPITAPVTEKPKPSAHKATIRAVLNSG